MSKTANETPVMSHDIKASFLAAFKRIQEVPAGATLIDSISDAEWRDEAVSDWNINVCSSGEQEADELDAVDTPVVAVA